MLSYNAQIIEGIRQYEQQNLEQAQSLFQQALLQNPQRARAYFELAILQRDRGNHELALRRLNQALRRRAYFPRAYLERGRLHTQLGNWREAYSDYLRFVEFTAPANANTIQQEIVSVRTRLQNRLQVSTTEWMSQHKQMIHPEQVVIYTVVTNQYDTLKKPLFIQEGVRYIAFVDQTVGDIPAPWQAQPIHHPQRNPRVTARYYKLLPHRLFPDFHYSIWVDATLVILQELLLGMSVALTDHDIAFFRHPKRDCIYEEAAVVLEKELAEPERLTQQIETYQREQYPPHFGLFNSAFQMRRHTERLQITMEAWWAEIDQYTQRDQISGPYILRKHHQEWFALNSLLPSRDDLLLYVPHRRVETYLPNSL